MHWSWQSTWGYFFRYVEILEQAFLGFKPLGTNISMILADKFTPNRNFQTLFRLFEQRFHDETMRGFYFQRLGMPYGGMV